MWFKNLYFQLLLDVHLKVVQKPVCYSTLENTCHKMI